MSKINKILIGSNNKGKFKEIADLLPSELKKISPNQFKIDSPEENGKTFIKNSEIKADFYCKKTNIVKSFLKTKVICYTKCIII